MPRFFNEVKARKKIFLGCCCLPVCLFILVGISLPAAVVVFNNDSVLIASKLVEKNDEIIVTLPEGEVTFTRDQVAWYSKNDNLMSFWEAAQVADKEGRPEIEMRLAKEVLVKEPLHGAEARAMIFQLEQKKLEKVQAAFPSEANNATSSPAANPTMPSSQSGFVPLNPASTPATGGFTRIPNGKVGSVESGKQIEAAPESVADWPVEQSVMSAEDLRVNVIIAGIFGLIILLSVWKITVSD